MEIVVDGVRLEDYEALCAVLDEGDAHHREALPHIFQRPPGPVRSRAFLEAFIEDEHKAIFVARSSQGLVGAVEIEHKSVEGGGLFVGRSYAVVHGLTVASCARRCGVGRALMEEARAWALGRGLGSVQLSVWAFNQGAIDFYKQLGYEPTRMWMALDVD